ncbi:major facilitator superfamily transporter [Xylaria intraflava]|nr:major facilitator superfamily transporter [Xylaria intraflava]
MATGRSQNGGAATPHEHATTAETTPLLTSSSSPSPGSPKFPPPKVTTAASGPRHRPEKPLPIVQILFLCYARMTEPLAFFSIFPYINKMVRENGNLAEADMGFYSGLIESLFSLTQMIVMVAWGRAADRFGRKPVLVVSLIGLAVSTALFGMAKNIWQMVLFRCAAGVFAGTVLTIRTMFSEHSTSQTQARAFSLFAVSGNLGIFFGPLIGGALADPAEQYPNLFGGIPFFEAYPYALSSFVVGAIALTSVVTTAVFVEETLHRNTKSDDEMGAVPQPRQASTWELLKSPGVGIVLYNYGHVMVLAFAYTAVMPVFWATQVDLGGFGLIPLQLSLFMAVSGLAQTLWLLLVFPPLQQRIGTNGVMRVCGIAYPFLFLSMPPLNAILRWHSDGKDTAFWIFAPFIISAGTGVSMAFTAVQLALNDVSPSYETLGMLNALALTLTSGLRAFSPALFASLFAIGVGHQILYGYFVWVVLAILAVGFTIATRFMPEASEKSAENERDGYED